ncbi:MAG: glycine zipper 2TM domain-containing protein [Burkholderiales bacterium]|nr:glycine zipper 2TM domain-containing protein [Burkholderiales bacterium]
MKQLAVIPLALVAAGALAQETGRVISSVPVIQQVAVQRQVCSNQVVPAAQPQTSGLGGLFGAIAGAAIGSQIGSGSGRIAATMAGTVGGALLGNSAEAQGGAPYATQQVQNCTPQTSYENRAVGYDVTYEFGGKQYTARMPNDPGPTVQLQVTPVPDARPPAAGQPLVTAPPVSQVAPVVVPAETLHTVVYPSYTYVRPAPYYWYPPVTFSFGYVHHGGRHWHRRWR